jgi:hypothetical protein
MEVHHHPKVGSENHRKKKFKEYFLEFLMIFLAVTLGFIAENIREKSNEKHNAKEYARLLVNDLSVDLAEFKRTDHVLKRIIGCGDTLSELIRTNDIKKIPSGKLYYNEYWSGWQWKVTTRDATLKEMESSGALRYLGNKSLIKKILDYEESLKIISLLEDEMNAEKNGNWNLVEKVFDVSYFKTFQQIPAARRDSASQPSEDGITRLDSILNNNYPLLTYDRNVWMELSNRALTSSDNYSTLLWTVSVGRKNAEETIEALKAEYGFE